MLITFEVSKNEVLKRIATNSYYRGERFKEESGAHAARMQAGADNNDVLADELELAAADVSAMITRNLGRCVCAAKGEEGVLYVEVEGKIWVLKHSDGDNYNLPDGRNIYMEGNTAVGSEVSLRDTAASVNYSGVVVDAPIEFRVVAASNFPTELKESVEAAIMAYLYDKVLEGWMLINMPAEVNNLAQRSANDAEKLRQLLVERKKPIR